MSFSLDNYKIFASVMNKRSFSAAAAELFITQPAVSHAIKQMEQDIGARLFVRTKSGIIPTPEGEILAGYISSALSLINAGEQRVKKLTELSAGTLKIGASDTISKWFLTPFIGEFHRLYPDISISITNRTSSGILTLLSEGKVDIGYVNLPINSPGMLTLSCKTVNDIFIAGKRYSELKGHRLELSELTGYPLIMLERAANSRKWVDRFFLSRGISLEAQIELCAHDLIADYVKIGLGIGCVTKEFISDLSGEDGLFMLDLTDPIPCRSIGVCYPERIELSAAARKFIDMTRQ